MIVNKIQSRKWVIIFLTLGYKQRLDDHSNLFTLTPFFPFGLKKRKSEKLKIKAKPQLLVKFD